MTKKIFVICFIITLITLSSMAVYATVGPLTNSSEEDLSKADVMAVSTAMNESAEDALLKAEKKIEEEKKIAEKVASEKRRENYVAGLSAYIRRVNGNISAGNAEGMARSFIEYGEKYGVDAKLIAAIAHNESTFYADAVSCEDFKGLMQTGDGLARNAGFSPSQLFDYRVSIQVGAKYLRAKMDEFGDTKLALTAYNQGSGSVYSGNYSTGYAERAMERAEEMERCISVQGEN